MGFYRADWRRKKKKEEEVEEGEEKRETEGEDHGGGRVRGDRYGKGRKNYQRHLTCSSSHYFPQFLSLENMQQIHKQQQHVAFKHHVTTRQPSHSFPTEVKANWATWPTTWHLCFSIKQKHLDTDDKGERWMGHTLLSLLCEHVWDIAGMWLV